MAAVATALVAARTSASAQVASQRSVIPDPLASGTDTLDGSAYGTALASLPRERRAELTALVDSARAVGLPTTALERKIVEGVAKRADPARIANVVRSVGAGLRVAKAALGPVNDAELEAAGAAVQAGVVPEQLRQLRASLPRGRSLTQAAVVLTDLTRRGVPSTEGARAIVRLARAGAGDADLARWRAEVAADVAAGVGGPAAATRRADTFLRGRASPTAPVASPVPGSLDP